MTESSRGRVTISIGRGGRQVIRRAGSGLDRSDEQSLLLVGTKRSLRDRLGGDTESSMTRNGPVDSKRQRGEIPFSSRDSNGVGADIHLGQDDLRYKLMRKNASRRSDMDLREKLDRTAHSSMKVLHTQRHMPERKQSSSIARIPPSRVINKSPREDPLGSSSYVYRSRDLGRIRQQSPERMAATSRGLSLSRSREDMQRVSAMRSSDDARSISYMRKEMLEPPRPDGANAVDMRNPSHPTANFRPPQAGLWQIPPTQSTILQRSPFTVNEHQSVDGLLQALGLGKYAILLKAEEVDMTVLKQMGESDLKEIGIPMGPRKKILLALAPGSKRQQ
ncbi:hypothetical protein MLD38_008520 [Melastoma candidum]|uniref:Uncharacterized protein n=1 Tax=Melastoma candidum TaxID=119954 RepID=A0ACB9RUJ7_9MYRT|nr:hypothetical protein MLD38_008520 [Melastoma candidum]